MAEKKKGGKSPLLIVLLIVIALILCACCCFGSFVGIGILGYLPVRVQESYDEQDWFWDDRTDVNDDTDDSNDALYPHGDVDNWWWTGTEAQREAYTKNSGYPYFLYTYDIGSMDWTTDWYTDESCTPLKGPAKDWWYDLDSDTRDCYIFMNGLPPFLYGGNWDNSDWKSDNDCSHPNGDIIDWWWTASNKELNCFVWENGVPPFLYIDSWQDDFDGADDPELDCSVELDCDFPNGDVDYWWYDASEAMKSCYISEYGYPSFWQGGVCKIPEGLPEEWWCEADTDTRLCYIDYYGLPWFFGE